MKVKRLKKKVLPLSTIESKKAIREAREALATVPGEDENNYEEVEIPDPVEALVKGTSSKGTVSVVNRPFIREQDIRAMEEHYLYLYQEQRRHAILSVRNYSHNIHLEDPPIAAVDEQRALRSDLAAERARNNLLEDQALLKDRRIAELSHAVQELLYHAPSLWLKDNRYRFEELLRQNRDTALPVRNPIMNRPWVTDDI